MNISLIIIAYRSSEDNTGLIICLDKKIRLRSWQLYDYLNQTFPAYKWELVEGSIDEPDGVTYRAKTVYGGFLDATFWFEG